MAPRRRCIDCARSPTGGRAEDRARDGVLPPTTWLWPSSSGRPSSWWGPCSASAGSSGPNRPQDEKFVTYEAGSDPIGVFGQSNVRYYVYALLFVMFDVEAVFIFPWSVRLDSLGWFGLVEMFVFIVLLTLGLVYAWRKGVLRWA